MQLIQHPKTESYPWLGKYISNFEESKPLYQYRYATEDLMKTAASTFPVHGYRVVEGGYYPHDGFGGGISQGGLGSYGPGFGGAGYNSGIGKFGKIGGYGYGGYGGGYGGYGGGYEGPGFAGQIGYGPGFGAGPGYVGAPFHGGYGGAIVDKNIYSGGKKNIIDENYEKVHGNEGHEINGGQEGYNHGSTALKNIKGDSGYYNEEEGGKKLFEDGKNYHGAQHFNQEGKNGEEKKLNNGHRKGHSIKGFKTSHHKDESGKTEEYYDEENDEGNNVLYKGQHGAFGEDGASSFKGGHADGKFNAGESKKEGHYDQEHFIDNAKGGKGSFGSKKFAGSGESYGVNNGLDQQSLLGHQESERFFKHHPHHTPFYGGSY
ncbi:hypothetical protein WA026_003652 [Henosepilachna vigintioctopunctata]|uniref:Glycine-rich cell wall structural protein 1.8-like n=1 Tax=Henosepilachna vigintioctopunctata TaxID=420089 RepID=A0AAW1UDV1_9CUCU